MLANKIKTRTEDYLAKFRSDNKLYQMTRSGQLTPAHLVAYFSGAEISIRNTVPELGLAAKVASERGMLELSQFFLNKIPEEAGHEQWAVNDQNSIKNTYGTTDKHNISPAIMRYVETHYNGIKEDPRLYLVYMFFAEYFAVIAVPQWAADLATYCGISSKHLTTVINHAEVDKDHVVEDMREIDKYLSSASLEQPCLNYFDNVSTAYWEFAEAVANLPKTQTQIR